MNQSKVWKHLAALVYDIFPILGIFLTTSLFLLLLRQGQEIGPHNLWFQLLLLFEVWFYFAYSWKKGGQTLGMRAWKLGIVNHHKMTWSAATLRFLAGLLSTLLLGLGLWAKLWRQDQQSWMDMACGLPTMDVTTNEASG